MKETTFKKENGEPGTANPLEFDCQAPLRFYEHCAKCVRFGDGCPYLKLGLELFLKEKKLCYDAQTH